MNRTFTAGVSACFDVKWKDICPFPKVFYTDCDYEVGSTDILDSWSSVD